ncbi:MAG: DUF4138 domain-containing protein [Bacteroidales bacterium]|nr:DUF4138 domain-containing protein [Bacteroidales bacterium]
MENLKKNLSITLSSTNPYSFSSHNSKIYFVVTNIMNDESFTYLKMYLVNKSTSRYTFGDIIITQVENPLGGKKSGSILHSKFIEPVEVKLPVDSEVNARAKQAIVIAIPLYTGTDNGKLIIQMFEKNGSRNGKIELKGKDITKATLIRN